MQLAGLTMPLLRGRPFPFPPSSADPGGDSPSSDTPRLRRLATLAPLAPRRGPPGRLELPESTPMNCLVESKLASEPAESPREAWWVRVTCKETVFRRQNLTEVLVGAGHSSRDQGHCQHVEGERC